MPKKVLERHLTKRHLEKANRQSIPGYAVTSSAWRSLLKLAGKLQTTGRAKSPVSEATATSFAVFVQELEILRLDNQYFGWQEYHDRLEYHLGINVHIEFVPDNTDPILNMILTQEGWPGCTYREETGDALILVSASLDRLATSAVIYHELGHIAGGHPVPRLRVSGTATVESLPRRVNETAVEYDAEHWWDPPRSVLGPTAPRDAQYCERDARLRAEYAMLAGAYGRDYDRSDESFFHLEDRPLEKPEH